MMTPPVQVLSRNSVSHPFSEESRMHLIHVPELQVHINDRQMSVISQYNAQNVQREVY
jgi:hypothetical protein